MRFIRTCEQTRPTRTHGLVRFETNRRFEEAVSGSLDSYFANVDPFAPCVAVWRGSSESLHAESGKYPWNTYRFETINFNLQLRDASVSNPILSETIPRSRFIFPRRITYTSLSHLQLLLDTVYLSLSVYSSSVASSRQRFTLPRAEATKRSRVKHFRCAKNKVSGNRERP